MSEGEETSGESNLQIWRRSWRTTEEEQDKHRRVVRARRSCARPEAGEQPYGKTKRRRPRNQVTRQRQKHEPIHQKPNSRYARRKQRENGRGTDGAQRSLRQRLRTCGCGGWGGVDIVTEGRRRRLLGAALAPMLFHPPTRSIFPAVPRRCGGLRRRWRGRRRGSREHRRALRGMRVVGATRRTWGVVAVVLALAAGPRWRAGSGGDGLPRERNACVGVLMLLDEPVDEGHQDTRSAPLLRPWGSGRWCCQVCVLRVLRTDGSVFKRYSRSRAGSGRRRRRRRRS